MSSSSIEPRIILFDGVCNLCSGVVLWVIRRDPQAKFRFASLQSSEGQQLLATFQLDSASLDSIVLIEDDCCYTKSTAILRIFRQLHRLYPALYMGIALPTSWRNLLYDFIAKRRYTWFGKTEACLVPTAEWRARFLEYDREQVSRTQL